MKTRALAISLLSLTALAQAESLSPDVGVSKMGTKIPYAQMKADDLGEHKVNWEEESVRPLSPVPAPGIHPRILQSPEDRDKMRKIYKSTASGKLMWTMLIAYTEKLKGKLTQKSDFPTHPNGKLLSAYERGGWSQVGQYYAHVLNNNMEPDDLGIDPKKGYAEIQDEVLGCMALEAYRCWMENDARAAQVLCKAIENFADYLGERIKPGGMPVTAGGSNMAFCYDYAYNFMSDKLRGKIRKLIATMSVNKAHYGTFIEPDATTSNWMPLDNYFAIPIMAIEGEEGFNENYYKGYVRAYRNFLTYGWYKSGCPYEGIGKNNQFVATMQILTRRGIPLHNHPHVRAFGAKFMPGVSLPNANGFIGQDDWGGTGRDSILGGYKMNIDDIIGLKWMYPTDKAIDYAWGIYMGQLYERFTDFRVAGYFNGAITAIMFPSDTINKKLDAKQAGIDRTFFCPERGYMVTKSDLSKNAAMLAMHTRQDKGGHTSADRNSFIFASHGRLWAYQATQAGSSNLGTVNESRNFSVITIDDVGQCGPAKGTLSSPGKVIEFKNENDYTSMTGDAKYAYDWEWSSYKMGGLPNTDSPLLAQGWTKVMESPNDFQYEKQPYTFMDKPFYEQNHWLNPYNVQQYVKRAWNPVKKAYRQATLVRGQYPFALIVDDIEAQDDDKHLFKWNMQVSADVEIGQFVNPKSGKYQGLILCGSDVALDSKNKAKPKRGDRMLYIISLGSPKDKQYDLDGSHPRLEENMLDPRFGNKGKRIVIPRFTHSPDYKIILYPYRYGEPLPKIAINDDESEVILGWAKQQVKLSFKPEASGKTKVDIQLNN